MENKSIKVLFVDDDLIIGKAVVLSLQNNGYDVFFQSSLTAIESIISELNPNIIILDVEIGKDDGIDASKNIRNLFPNIPIIFVSSHIDSSVAIRALENGGVTYLRKPFNYDELTAYIKRYANIEHINEIKFGMFTLDFYNRILINNNNNNKQNLNKKESLLLKILVSNINKITLREFIIDEIWNNNYESNKSLNNYIAKIRQYLLEDNSIQIETVSGEGYKLTCSKII